MDIDMPQLHINQGPQDALLYDNSRSYFTNVGYVRTSNFQVELRDVEVTQPNLGTTLRFTIPKAADLLGPCDLLIDLAKVQSDLKVGDNTYAAWVESLGYAMIDKIEFQVNSTIVETVTGEQLNILNELMRKDDQRYGYDMIGKTGRAPTTTIAHRGLSGANSAADYAAAHPDNNAAITGFANYPTVPTVVEDRRRMIYVGKRGTDNTATSKCVYPTDSDSEKQLIIPLGLFFTKHPSQYFPLCAIAGCNDIVVAVKLRPLSELVTYGILSPPVVGEYGNATTVYDSTASTGTSEALHTSVLTLLGAIDGTKAREADNSTADKAWDNNDWRKHKFVEPKFDQNSPISKARLRCHYIHVTGPEATQLMNKEHVRLMKMWHCLSNVVNISATNSPGKVQLAAIDLNFLHPVQELIITIRKSSELRGGFEGPNGTLNDADQKAGAKNFFAYHGSGKDPNIESWVNRVHHEDGFNPRSDAGDPSATSGVLTSDALVGVKPRTIKVHDFKLTLNGQDRHPSLSADGLDRNYLMNRLMPMLHSNTSSLFNKMSTDGEGSIHAGGESDMKLLSEMLDRKEIYVYPFALNPEGQNPSGAVNFSKVSHAKLTITGDASMLTQNTDFQIDVYGVYYNWLQIKDGRALMSFA